MVDGRCLVTLPLFFVWVFLCFSIPFGKFGPAYLGSLWTFHVSAVLRLNVGEYCLKALTKALLRCTPGTVCLRTTRSRCVQTHVARGDHACLRRPLFHPSAQPGGTLPSPPETWLVCTTDTETCQKLVRRVQSRRHKIRTIDIRHFICLHHRYRNLSEAYTSALSSTTSVLIPRCWTRLLFLVFWSWCGTDFRAGCRRVSQRIPVCSPLHLIGKTI